MPCHNGSKTLEASARSVLDQSHEDLELLIVDDGSTDDSREIARALSDEDKRVKTLSTGTAKACGVSAARNAGLKEAKGDYITFLDADDLFLKDALAYLLRIAEENKADIAGCSFARFTLKGKSEEDFLSLIARAEQEARKEVPVRVISGDNYIEHEILYGNSRCWSKLYTKELLENVRFKEDFTIGEDMLFVLGLLPRAARIALSDAPYYLYRDNEQGAMRQPYKPTYLDQIRCWDEAAAWVKKRRPAIYEKPAMKAAFARVGIISALLTAGKLAMLSPSDRAKYAKDVDFVRGKVKEYKKVPGAFASLDNGYKVKCTIFSNFPKIYFRTYGPYKGLNQD